MIRKLKLVCSKCGKAYAAGKTLFYIDDFKGGNFNHLPLLCSTCVAEWEAYWKIAGADFQEEAGNVYVTIRLANGSVHEKLDCTPMDDIVAVGLDIPEKAQKKLYHIYRKWYDEKIKDYLKICTFQESFMRTSFTCETHGGDRYEDIAFRFNRLGVLETQSAVPDFIKKQIAEKWEQYELTHMPVPDLNAGKENFS